MLPLGASAQTVNPSCGTATSAKPFTEGQYQVLEVVTLTGAAFSMAGSAFIVCSYLYFPELRTFPYKLIVLLSFADFFGSLAYYVDIDGNFLIDECDVGAQCLISAGMTQFFEVATFMWTTVIAYNIYQVLAKGRGRAVERNEVYYHLFAWGVPAVALIVAIATKSFGDAGNWCWITEQFQELRFALYYIPLVLVLLVNSGLYYMIIKAVRTTSPQAGAVEFRLRLYLVAFGFVRVWSVINRVQNAAAPDSPVYFLFFMHSLFSPVQGFVNCMIYGFNRKVLRQYRTVFQSKCPCCFRRARQEDVPNPLAAVGSPVVTRNPKAPASASTSSAGNAKDGDKE